MAPPSISPSSRLPYDAKLGSDAESRSIAAEVAAILSKEQQESAPAPQDAAPRPLIVKLPSERWLSESAVRLESIPLESRAAAFQAIVEKYRSMRAAERESMRRR
jgi:hypothetical protein